MATTYLAIQAPNDLYYVVTKCGVVAVNGTLETFDSLTGLPKPTYADPFKQNPNPTRIRLGSNGSPGFPIYWDTLTSLYKIVVRDAAGNIIDENDNYPIVTQSTSSGPINLTLDATNYSRNPQFYFWSEYTTYTNDLLPVGSTNIADDWFFTRSNTDADITISRQVFPAGDTSMPGTPPTYMLYTVTTASADSKQDFGQRYENVQTLSNTIITDSMYLQSALIGDTATVDLVVIQNFGTGGSTTVETVVDNFTIDDTMQMFSSTFTVPAISGLTIGSGSYVEIAWRFNPSQVQSVNIGCNRFQKGVGTGSVFPYLTLNQQYAQIFPYDIAGYFPNQGTNLIGWTANQTLFEFLKTVEFKSALKAWYFSNNPNQMGQTINSSSVYPNNDGTYIADMTILQSDGNNIVNKTSFIGEALTLSVVTPAKKFGIGQILDPLDVQYLYDLPASGFFSNTSTTSSASCKVAIIGWNGAANAFTKQFVVPGGWQAAGTNPTLNAGWNYLTVASYTLSTTSFGVIENFVMPSADDYSTFGVFWWIDDLSMVASDEVSFGYGNLTQTERAVTSVIPETFEDTLQECERYFLKSYDKSNPNFAFNNGDLAIGITVPTTFSPSGEGVPNPGTQYPAIPFSYTFPFTYENGPANQFSVWVGNSYFNFRFPTQMAKIPAITIYNPNNYPSNTVQNFIAYSGSAVISVITDGFAESPFSISNIDENTVSIKLEQAGLVFQNVGGGGGGTTIFDTPAFCIFNIVADATLGV